MNWFKNLPDIILALAALGTFASLFILGEEILGQWKTIKNVRNRAEESVFVTVQQG